MIAFTSVSQVVEPRDPAIFIGPDIVISEFSTIGPGMVHPGAACGNASPARSSKELTMSAEFRSMAASCRVNGTHRPRRRFGQGASAKGPDSHAPSCERVLSFSPVCSGFRRPPGLAGFSSFRRPGAATSCSVRSDSGGSATTVRQFAPASRRQPRSDELGVISAAPFLRPSPNQRATEVGGASPTGGSFLPDPGGG